MSILGHVESTPAITALPDISSGTLCLWRGLIGKVEAWRDTPEGRCYYVSGIVINGVPRVYWLAWDDIDPIHIGEDGCATTWGGGDVTSLVAAYLARGE